MAPQSLAKDKFSTYFAALKSQSYHDNASSIPRGGAMAQGIRSIAWNTLGSLIATGSADKTLRVWNPEKPHARFSTELKGHAAPIEKVAFNPVKDAELASVSNDGVVKFWDVRTKACFNEIKNLGEAFSLAWANEEKLVVGNKTDHVFVLSPQKSTPLASHQQSDQTNQIAFCPSGEKVFVTTGSGRTRILSFPEFEPLIKYPYETESQEFALDVHTSACFTAELHPSGKYLATGGSDSLIALWETQEWICARTLSNTAGSIRSLSFTFDGIYIAAGSDEGPNIEVSHTEDGDAIHTFKTIGACPVVAWSPTRYCLAYADVGVLRTVGLDSDRK